MNNFQQASKQKLRIATAKGNLSVEQLWDLSLEELDTLAVKLEEEYNSGKGKSFLSKTTEKDKTIKLKFDIVIDILTTKVEERNASQDARDIKEHNQKILERIAAKKDAALDDMSVEELEKLMK